MLVHGESGKPVRCERGARIARKGGFAHCGEGVFAACANKSVHHAFGMLDVRVDVGYALEQARLHVIARVDVDRVLLVR